MPRQTTGYYWSTGRGKNRRWYGRCSPIDQSKPRDASGRPRRRNIVVSGHTKADAQRELERALARFRRDELRARTMPEHEPQTLAQLVTYWESEFAHEAEYNDERRSSGMRSWKSARQSAQQVLKFFGNRRLDAIRYDDCRRLREDILRTPTRFDRPRSVAHCNRLMTMLRHLLNIAVRQKWIPENPMLNGDPLILAADEKRRDRATTRAEEDELLRIAGSNTGSPHMHALVMLAIDTGFRLNEMLRLEWSDVDFAANTITVRALNSKTLRERSVHMTPRVRKELQTWRETQRTKHDTGARKLPPRIPVASRDTRFVFGGIKSVKTAWRTLRRLAGVEGLRLHDHRHATASRLVKGGMELSQVAKVLGHADPRTTYRYATADEDTRERAAEILSGHIRPRRSVRPLSRRLVAMLRSRRHAAKDAVADNLKPN